jgi:hypothetical protein
MFSVVLLLSLLASVRVLGVLEYCVRRVKCVIVRAAEGFTHDSEIDHRCFHAELVAELYIGVLPDREVFVDRSLSTARLTPKDVKTFGVLYFYLVQVRS